MIGSRLEGADQRRSSKLNKVFQEYVRLFQYVADTRAPIMLVERITGGPVGHIGTELDQYVT